MEDPREHVEDDYNQLTEDSSDELADLEKEFEMKRQKILAKKAAAKKSKREVEVNSTPTKTPKVEGEGGLDKTVKSEPGAMENNARESLLVGRSPDFKTTDTLKKEQGNKHLNKENDNKHAIKQGASTRESNWRDHEKSYEPNPYKTNPYKPNQYNTNQHSRKPAQPSNFAAKLLAARQLEDTTAKINYSVREYSFEGLPPRENILVDEIDVYSSLKLMKRYIKKEDLFEHLKNVKILRIDKLLAKVQPPKYEEPMYLNWCFIGILLQKSEPKLTKNVNPTKFMRLTIGNFNNSIELMIFGDAFNKYWKLQKGEVIGILNPEVKKLGKGFSLGLKDNNESIIEIGYSKDFGYCESTTKEQKKCRMVIDKSKTSLCIYHENQKYQMSGRMELNGSVGVRNPIELEKKINRKRTWESIENMSTYNELTSTHVSYEGGRLSKDYDDPKLIVDNKTKRKRLDQERSNQLLEAKLMGSKNSLAKTLGIIKKEEARESNFKKQGLDDHKQAFNNSLLTKIGFDPTIMQNQNQVDEIYKSPTKKRNELSKDLKELYEISNNKRNSRELTSSKQERLDKRKKWNENIENLQKYKGVHKKPPVYEDESKNEASPRRTNRVILSDEEDEVHAPKGRHLLKEEMDNEESLIDNDSASDDSIEFDIGNDFYRNLLKK